jgi:hypothetical protein
VLGSLVFTLSWRSWSPLQALRSNDRPRVSQMASPELGPH